jgi:hypothetical protein
VKSTKADRIGAIAGDLCAVEDMFACKDLMARLGSKNIDARQRGSMIDPRWGRAAYLFNASIPGIDQMGGMGFLGNLLGQSTGLDTNAIQAILQGQQQQNQFALGKQGLGIQQQGLNLDQQQQQYLQQLGAMGFMNQNPWDMLNNYGNLVSGLTGQYGTGTGHQDTPYQGPSPFEAAIQGGIGGFSMGGGFGGLMGGGQQQQQPAPYSQAANNYFRPWGT